MKKGGVKLGYSLFNIVPTKRGLVARIPRVCPVGHSPKHDLIETEEAFEDDIEVFQDIHRERSCHSHYIGDSVVH